MYKYHKLACSWWSSVSYTVIYHPHYPSYFQCECSDDFCEDSKARVEICRPQVTMANRNETVVSCRVAQWICAADALCSKALEYYNEYCRSMFHGKKCSHRCQNSINILRRQEKAAKLNTCKCDGHEEYDCPRIQSNMARLCFHKPPPEDAQPPAAPKAEVPQVTVCAADSVASARCVRLFLVVVALVTLT